MALCYPSSSLLHTRGTSRDSSTSSPFAVAPLHLQSLPIKTNLLSFPANEKWRAKVSFLSSFLKKGKNAETLKEELLEAISLLDRGADATPEDQQRVDKMARELEAVNPTKEPLRSDLLNGKWELLYTTSVSILQTGRPKFLRSRVNYQAINVDTLRAQNMESGPFFNQFTSFWYSKPARISFRTITMPPKKFTETEFEAEIERKKVQWKTERKNELEVELKQQWLEEAKAQQQEVFNKDLEVEKARLASEFTKKNSHLLQASKLQIRRKPPHRYLLRRLKEL